LCEKQKLFYFLEIALLQEAEVCISEDEKRCHSKKVGKSAFNILKGKIKLSHAERLSPAAPRLFII